MRIDRRCDGVRTGRLRAVTAALRRAVVDAHHLQGAVLVLQQGSTGVTSAYGVAALAGYVDRVGGDRRDGEGALGGAGWSTHSSFVRPKPTDWSVLPAAGALAARRTAVMSGMALSNRARTMSRFECGTSSTTSRT